MSSEKKSGDSFIMTVLGMLVVGLILASLIAPMIPYSGTGEIRFATKAKMQNLKTALINFQVDFGFLPFEGDQISLDAYERANRFVLGPEDKANVLFSNAYPGNFLVEAVSCDEEKYRKRWKGPYLEADVKEAFTDSYGNRIWYRAEKQGLFLHSAGEDGKFDEIEKVSDDSTYRGDDILVRVAKFRSGKY